MRSRVCAPTSATSCDAVPAATKQAAVAGCSPPPLSRRAKPSSGSLPRCWCRTRGTERRRARAGAATRCWRRRVRPSLSRRAPGVAGRGTATRRAKRNTSADSAIACFASVQSTRGTTRSPRCASRRRATTTRTDSSRSCRRWPRACCTKRTRRWRAAVPMNAPRKTKRTKKTPSSPRRWPPRRSRGSREAASLRRRRSRPSRRGAERWRASWRTLRRRRSTIERTIGLSSIEI